MTATPRWLADPFHVPAQRPADHHAADPPSRDLAALHREFIAAVEAGATAHEVVWCVDQFFSRHGLPSALAEEA